MTYIHETAIIDQGATIGKETKIWHWVHISGGAKIGAKCSLGQNVFVGNKVTIGNHVKIQNNVSIYDNITIEDYVFCGPSMVFTNVINPRSEIARKTEYKDTIIKKGVTIGANATIICGNNIGEYAFIGAGAVITKTIKPYALIVGNPGKQVGWMSRFGEKIPLPVTGTGKFFCQNLKEEYILDGDKLIVTSL